MANTSLPQPSPNVTTDRPTFWAAANGAIHPSEIATQLVGEPDDTLYDVLGADAFTEPRSAMQVIVLPDRTPLVGVEPFPGDMGQVSHPPKIERERVPALRVGST